VTQFLQATVAGLSLASIYILLALGFVIIYKSMQVLSFAHPAVMIFGAYMVSYFTLDRGWNFWLALLAGGKHIQVPAGTVVQVSLKQAIAVP